MGYTTLGALPWVVLAVSRLANAACECGYSLNKTSDPSHAVFTELLENDFLHTSSPESIELRNYGWQPQVYAMDKAAARGPYGKDFSLNNIVTNPLKGSGWSGASEHGGDAGLELWVRAQNGSNYVSGAEIVTMRDDALLGSFRVGMKLSNSSGTCGAFFFYHNNSQEIDMEFLSHQFNESRGAVNLVLQSPESIKSGFDASSTSGFKVEPLPFRPDHNFHEYRFDWTANRVAFYIDGQFLYDITDHVPVEGGAIFFNHWSNGDPKWSAGPPTSDTVMTISYMKAYFNSTDTARSKTAYRERCPKYDAAKVCAIPGQDRAPDSSIGKDGLQTYFFSQQGDMAPGQTVYKTSAANIFGVPLLSLAGPLLVTLLSCTLTR